eukprot:3247752-Amphidinium_carterae.1
MLYLQLPKEGARDAGERRPIALLPQVYRLWCALCKQDVKAWRARCTDRGAGTLEWPLDTEVWERALNKGRGRGPIRHLRLLADRLAWLPAEGG